MSETRNDGDPTLSRSDLLRGTLAGGALLAAGGLGGAGSALAATRAVGTVAAKRGGTLRVALISGGPGETLDAHRLIADPDLARTFNLHRFLVSRKPDATHQLDLAEVFEGSKDGKTWTIRVKDGVEFHNGKSVGADDVIFSIRRIIKVGGPVSGLIGALGLTGMKKVDARTARCTFARPTAIFDDLMTSYSASLVPVGFNPKKPIGCGPFKFKSFVPGEESVFERFENFFGQGPHVDELRIISFNEDASRMNALLGGQVDAAQQIPYGQIGVVKARRDLKLLNSKTGATIMFTMRTDTPPFDDVRVRQALRLIVDRQEMIDQALAGYADVGNDLFSRYGECYASSIPQRKQNVAKAKALLAAAGKSNLTVELVVAPGVAGIVEAAQVFAQQAKEAGVTIKVRKLDIPGFYSQYIKWPFAFDFFFNDPPIENAGFAQTSTSFFNTTHFNDPEYDRLFKQCVQALSHSKRCAIVRRMQQIEYDRGGNITWAFRNVVDAHSKKVTGFVPDRNGVSFTSFRFERASFV